MHLKINKTHIWNTIMYRICLCHNNTVLLNDHIAFYLLNCIDISIQDYQNILMSCNAETLGEEYNRSYYFKNEKDIQEAIDILNEKYMTIIKLMGN